MATTGLIEMSSLHGRPVLQEAIGAIREHQRFMEIAHSWFVKGAFMMDEMIGPNSCSVCGGEYGEHEDGCRVLDGRQCGGASIQFIVERQRSEDGPWDRVFNGTYQECVSKRVQLESADSNEREWLSEQFCCFRVSLDRSSLKTIDRKPVVGERVLYATPRVFVYRDDECPRVYNVVKPIDERRCGKHSICIECGGEIDLIIAEFLKLDGVEFNKNLFWVPEGL